MKRRQGGGSRFLRGSSTTYIVFGRVPREKRVMTRSQHPILVGCSGWSYADWEGVFYPPGMPSGDWLEYYADRFPVVEVDSTFYRPPTARMVQAWRSRTPDDFRFALKVPQAITHEKRLVDCEAEVEGFVTSIRPLGEKLSAALLQMGYFNRGAFRTFGQFRDVLDDFLSQWPHDRVPLAVETRNPRWVNEELLAVLRRHNTALTLTHQKWMPRPAEILHRFDPVTGPFAFVRLLGDREAIEKLTTTWDKTIVDRTAELEETADVLQTLARRVPVLVFINNHFAGHAPATAAALRRLLGQPDPAPLERPRTTLFD
jgi:uncharacterized protein YecE (DUF72 family)